MKKISLFVLSVSLFLTPFLVLARGHHHHQTPPPVQIPPPVTKPPAPTSTPPVVPVTGLQLGAFNANIGSISVQFMAWKDVPPKAPAGKTLLLYWENPTVSYDQIINGSQDAIIRNFALEVGPNTILSIFHEMNLNESPWFGPASKEVLAFRHIHDLIGSKVQWAWVVNDASIPNQSGNLPTDYYPGDAYVDIKGVDGFNWGGTSFQQAIDPAFTQIAGINKPLWITSFGTGPTNQAAWITDAISQAKNDGISALVYFSYPDQGGTNFTLTSQGLAAFHL